MLTVEQKIVDALVQMLSAVPSIKGAYDGRVTPFSEQELPAAVVFTPTTEGDSVGAVQMDHDLRASVVLYAADRTAQKAIRALVGDVYAAIGANETLGLSEVISINDPAKAVKCIQQGDFIGSAQIALTVTYRTARWAL